MNINKEIQDFLKKAATNFEMLKPSKFYIDTPVKLSKDRLKAQSESIILQDPLIFLRGEDIDENSINYESETDQQFTPIPSINFIVGEYGQGKTELVLQTCKYLSKAKNLVALPVNLSRCRSRVSILNSKPTPEKFCELLFGELLDETNINNKVIIKSLISKIHSGEIYLILDGLDELISELDRAPTLHKNFFEGLIKFLDYKPKKVKCGDPKFKVIVSMRLEYLWVVSDFDASDLVRQIQSRISTAVNFLQLPFLPNWSMEQYLSNRINLDCFSKIQQREQLLEILRRPLYLKMFCDILTTDSREYELSLPELLTIEYRAELFEIFVKQASNVKLILPDLFNGFPAYIWDISCLSKKALELYQASKDQITIEELKNFLKISASNDALDDFDENEVKLRYIHKCPFLQRISETEFVFSHRAFLEFFTARGIAEELKKNNRNPFDEIVVNVDMRKFLKYFAEKFTTKDYASLSQESNGMNSEIGWTNTKFKINNEFWKELEKYRVDLLESMTCPEDPPKSIEESIDKFLDLEDTGLHPSYLKYNYEAVAVNIQYNWWDEKYNLISERFNKLLYKRMEKIKIELYEIDRLKFDQLKIILLLIERIFDISRRLRFGWIRGHVSWARKFCREKLLCLDLDESADYTTQLKLICNRINGILVQIENSNFITSYFK